MIYTFFLNVTDPFSTNPYLARSTLHYASSSQVRALHPSLANSALFISIDRLSLASPCSLGLHKTFQFSRCILLDEVGEPQTHCLMYLSISSWNLLGKCWSCMWNTPILLSTTCANVNLSALDKNLVFHTSSVSFTIWSISSEPLQPLPLSIDDVQGIIPCH